MVLAAQVAETPTTPQSSWHTQRSKVFAVLGALAAMSVVALGAAAYVTSAAIHARNEADDRRQRAEQALLAVTEKTSGFALDLAQHVRAVAGLPPALSKDFTDRIRGLLEQLTAAGEATPEVLHGIVAALDETALNLSAIGDTAGSYDTIDRGRQVIESRLAISPGDTSWQRQMSISYEKQGNVQFAQGNFAEALNSHQASLAIRNRLATADTSNTIWQRDLGVAHEKIGDDELALANFAQAVDAYQASLAIRDRLIKSDPGNALWARDLAVSHYKLGDLHMRQENWPEALESYQAGLPISERLAKVNPDNELWQRDLASLYDRIGDAQAVQGDFADGLKSFQASYAIRDRMAKFEPGDIGWQRDLAASFGKIAEVYRQTTRIPEAIEAARKGREIVTRLSRLSPGNATLRRYLAHFDEIAALTGNATPPQPQ